MTFSQLKALSQPPLPPQRKNTVARITCQYISTLYICYILLLSTCVEIWWRESPGQTLKSGQILNRNEAWVHGPKFTLRQGGGRVFPWKWLWILNHNPPAEAEQETAQDASVSSESKSWVLLCFTDGPFEIAKIDNKHHKYVRCDMSLSCVNIYQVHWVQMDISFFYPNKACSSSALASKRVFGFRLDRTSVSLKGHAMQCWNHFLKNEAQKLEWIALQYLCTSSAHTSFWFGDPPESMHTDIIHLPLCTRERSHKSIQKPLACLTIQIFMSLYMSIYMMHGYIRTVYYSIYNYNLSWLFLTYLSIHCRSSYEYMPT